MMAQGMVTGGWEFVQAAYVVSAAVYLGYFVSVVARYRAERQRAERDGEVS
jgi:hypothetical protein